MARQTGNIKIIGTIDGICFYKMQEGYFARLKSSLDKKRFCKDAAFEGSRRSAGALGRASKLASKLYRELPGNKKGREVFRELVGKIKLMQLDGYGEEFILRWFSEFYLGERGESNLKVDFNKFTFSKKKVYLDKKIFKIPYQEKRRRKRLKVLKKNQKLCTGCPG